MKYPSGVQSTPVRCRNKTILRIFSSVTMIRCVRPRSGLGCAKCITHYLHDVVYALQSMTNMDDKHILEHKPVARVGVNARMPVRKAYGLSYSHHFEQIMNVALPAHGSLSLGGKHAGNDRCISHFTPRCRLVLMNEQNHTQCWRWYIVAQVPLW
jgi:hypothetical protein